MDPSSVQRVDRMEADGLITPRQADMLRSSMSGSVGREAAAPRRSPTLAWLAAGLLVLAALVVIILLQPAGGPAEVQDVGPRLETHGAAWRRHGAPRGTGEGVGPHPQP